MTNIQILTIVIALATSFLAVLTGVLLNNTRLNDVKEVLAVRGQHPDLVAAALALGFRKVEHGKKPPTYDYP